MCILLNQCLLHVSVTDPLLGFSNAVFFGKDLAFLVKVIMGTVVVPLFACCTYNTVNLVSFSCSLSWLSFLVGSLYPKAHDALVEQALYVGLCRNGYSY